MSVRAGLALRAGTVPSGPSRLWGCEQQQCMRYVQKASCCFQKPILLAVNGWLEEKCVCGTCWGLPLWVGLGPPPEQESLALPGWEPDLHVRTFPVLLPLTSQEGLLGPIPCSPGIAKVLSGLTHSSLGSFPASWSACWLFDGLLAC